MPEFSTYIDIDASEYVSECSKSEINELIEELVFQGYIDKSNSVVDMETLSVMEQEFHEKLEKLKSNYLNIKLEDEEILKNLFIKYI
jgi:hypothetical protein|tara:strand:+ start:9147 stop:9407 length:261 start_codon:yes stop_codon:yes gene_type:complete